MHTRSDSQLLALCNTRGGNDAYRVLVKRCMDSVLEVARIVTHHFDLAENVAQLVFIDMVKLKGILPSGVPLGVWLYRNAFCLAIEKMITETARCSAAQSYLQSLEFARSDWSVLEDALQEMRLSDRGLIEERFYQNMSFAVMGLSLHISNDAARMKVNRALVKLRAIMLGGEDSTRLAGPPADDVQTA